MKKGFTLLELLVVVLIAGILASIALPQYQKAVERSRASEAMTIAKAIVDAQNRSLDAYPNDSVATKNALDISLPGGKWTRDDTYETALFTYELTNDGVAATRREGAYTYTLNFHNTNDPTSNSCSGNSSFCRGFANAGFTVGPQQATCTKCTEAEPVTVGEPVTDMEVYEEPTDESFEEEELNEYDLSLTSDPVDHTGDQVVSDKINEEGIPGDRVTNEDKLRP